MGAGQFIHPIIQKYNKLQGNRFVRSLGHKLSAGLEPICILVQGDSTGNETNEWVYKTMQWLMGKFPDYSFLYKLWDDTTQAYLQGSMPQSGSAGAPYAYFPGAFGDYVSTPDATALGITGDIDVSVLVSADDWTPSAAPTLISKFGASGQYGWCFSLLATGKPYWWWSTDGTANITKNATAIPTLVDGQGIWLRVTHDVDNGAGGNTVTFYTSTNGVTWTQLGDPVVTAGTTSIFDCNAPIELGSRSGGGTERFKGKFYKAFVKNGIDGTVVACPDLGLAHPSNITTFKDACGLTWTKNGNVTVGNGSPCVLILNASMPGATISYSTDETRFAKQTPIEPQLAFISFSHNEGSNVSYQSTYEGLCTQLLTAYPNVGIVCVTQNPQKSPEANVMPHTIRNRQIATLAAKNDYGLVDVFRAFMDTGDYESYVSADGCHPTQAGFDLWRDKVVDFLQTAVK